jgi:hypothetical protein
MKGAYMKRMRRILASMAGVVMVAASALVATPAHAVLVPDGVGFQDRRTCEDAGGVLYHILVDWNYKYIDAAGNRRVSVNPLLIRRPDGEAGPAADAGVDVNFDVYSGRADGTFYLIQRVRYDGIDLDFGVDDSVAFNPRNPLSRALITRIKVQVGTDGDGLANCPWLTFRQPVGIGNQPPPS